MRKFLHFISELKTWGCLSFTGALCVYMFIDLLCGGDSVSYARVVQLLALCGAITLLQYVFFSGQLLKKPGYGLRLALFCLLALCICGGFAWAFGWFPGDIPGAWLTFTAIFFAIFAVFCLGFELYFRAAGRRYDEALGRRRQDPPGDG